MHTCKNVACCTDFGICKIIFKQSKNRLAVDPLVMSLNPLILLDFFCFSPRSVDPTYDSFISTRNLHENLRNIQFKDLEACKAEMEEKAALLDDLLTHYNAGRQKAPFAMAVNLLPLEDLRAVWERLQSEAAALPLKERAKTAISLLRAAADIRGIDLKPRKKVQ